MERLFLWVDKVNRWVVSSLGLLLWAGVVLVILDILLRQFNLSFGGTDEISGYVMAIVTAWGMGYTLTKLGHIRIEILRARLSDRYKSILDLISIITLTGVVSLIATKAWPVVATTLANSSTANTPLETPLWIVQIPWFAGWVWFSIVSWIYSIAAIHFFVQRDSRNMARIAGPTENIEESL